MDLHQYNVSYNGLHLFSAHYVPGSMQYAYIIWIFPTPLSEMVKTNGSLFIFNKDFGVGYNSRDMKRTKKGIYLHLVNSFPFFSLISSWLNSQQLRTCGKGLNLRVSVLFLLPEMSAIYPPASSILSLTISNQSYASSVKAWKTSAATGGAFPKVVIFSEPQSKTHSLRNRGIWKKNWLNFVKFRHSQKIQGIALTFF